MGLFTKYPPSDFVLRDVFHVMSGCKNLLVGYNAPYPALWLVTTYVGHFYNISYPLATFPLSRKKSHLENAITSIVRPRKDMFHSSSR